MAFQTMIFLHSFNLYISFPSTSFLPDIAVGNAKNHFLMSMRMPLAIDMKIFFIW